MEENIYKCVKSAFVQGRLWSPDEDRLLVQRDKEELSPKCFVKVKVRNFQDAKSTAAKTLSEMNDNQGKARERTQLMLESKEALVDIAITRKLGKKKALEGYDESTLINIIVEGKPLADSAEIEAEVEKAYIEENNVRVMAEVEVLKDKQVGIKKEIEKKPSFLD